MASNLKMDSLHDMNSNFNPFKHSAKHETASFFNEINSIESSSVRDPCLQQNLNLLATFDQNKTINQKAKIDYLNPFKSNRFQHVNQSYILLNNENQLKENQLPTEQRKSIDNQEFKIRPHSKTCFNHNEIEKLPEIKIKSKISVTIDKQKNVFKKMPHIEIQDPSKQTLPKVFSRGTFKDQSAKHKRILEKSSAQRTSHDPAYVFRNLEKNTIPLNGHLFIQRRNQMETISKMEGSTKNELISKQIDLKEEKLRKKSRQSQYSDYVKKNFRPSISRLEDETMNSENIESKIISSMHMEDVQKKAFTSKRKVIEIGNQYLQQSRRFLSENEKMDNAKRFVEAQNRGLPSVSRMSKQDVQVVHQLAAKPKSLNAMTRFMNIIDKSKIGKNILSKDIMGQIKTAIEQLDHQIITDNKPNTAQFLSSMKVKLALIDKL